MGTGSENAEEMSFRMNYWNQEIFIEIASGDGGGGSLSPGRCLSLLSEYELGEFLGLCGTNNCDVDVTAFDGGDLEGAGAGDGESDEWHVDAYMDKTLIYNSELVYGMTTMTFGLEAIKE